MVKVAVVGTVGIPACYGGFESLVENLTKYSSEEVKYDIFCSSKSYPQKLSHYNGAMLSYVPLSANGAQSIPYDMLSLIWCIFKKPDVTLVLGVSGCLFLPIYRLFSKSKVVTNIDGLEWKRDKWSKWAKKFLKLSESIAVKYSDVVITDNKAIGEYVDVEYSKDNVVIAYGGDHAVIDTERVGSTEDYYLALCRIEPENNVEMILKAFAGSEHRLKFVGNWNASEFGRLMKSSFGYEENLELIDPIYELDELFALRSRCKGYIHGHSAGGTNPSLVEAMHFTKPVYAFDCSFNRHTTEDRAIYFSSEKELEDKLSLIKGKELKTVSNDMKEIANRCYTWSVVASAYEQIYFN